MAGRPTNRFVNVGRPARPAASKLSLFWATVPRSEVVVLVGPAIVLLIVFLTIPFIAAIGLSFTNQRLVSPLPTTFVGLRNYVRTFDDPRFLQALTNNVVFAVIVPTTQTILGLGLAILVNQRLRGVSIFRAIFFAPVVMVLTVVSVVWRLMFSQSGMINALIGTFTRGSFQPNWLHDPHLAFPAIMVMSIWQNVGFQMILLLAALQGIPGDLYEAGRVDGASSLQLFWRITLPSMRNALIFVLTVSMISSFNLFDQPYVMTGGGPLDATQTLMLLLVQVGYDEERIGQAAAIAVIFFVFVLALTVIARQVGSRMTDSS